MARIRSIKPDHRIHRKVGQFTDFEYRLWMSMINETDDKGRFVCEAEQMRVLTWPYHPKVKTAAVERAIQRIASLSIIQLYEVSGVRYAAYLSFDDHQHPKYPTPSKLPPPPTRPLPSEALILPQSSPSSPPGLTRERRVVESSRAELDREEGRERERGLGRGEPAPLPRRLLSKPSDNGRGTGAAAPHRPLEEILAEVKSQRPELSDSEQEDLAMKHYRRALG
jgi:hypothetical protein